MKEVNNGSLPRGLFRVPNKSSKYLMPCLKKYGLEFEKMYNPAFKVAVGLGDMIISDSITRYEQHLFILFNTKIATKFFIDFLGWIKDQDYYEEDYVFGNIQKSTLHMVIVKLPEDCIKAKPIFIVGHYSQMFTLKSTDEIFSNHPEIIKVLIKDHNYRINFVNKLNKKFGTTLTTEEYEGELDFPPKESEEMFNHHLKK